MKEETNKVNEIRYKNLSWPIRVAVIASWSGLVYFAIIYILSYILL